MSDDPQRLHGGNMGPVHRVGDTVVRESGDWSPAVHRLLNHLRAAGVPGVPEPRGFTEDGREVLSFLDGVVPSYPMPAWVWSEAALESSVALLRHIHDATEGVTLRGPWRSPVREPAEVICHNDFAPYNLVFEHENVTGVIDWDFASPGPRLWDLAYLAYRIVPLTTASDFGDGFGNTERLARLGLLLRMYGTDATPSRVIDVVVERLYELADFTDRVAIRLGDTDLGGHARLYRQDAAHLAAG